MSRYFARGQGISTSTHVSDQHATFDTKVIVATAPEGHYVLDGLLGNGLNPYGSIETVSVLVVRAHESGQGASGEGSPTGHPFMKH